MLCETCLCSTSNRAYNQVRAVLCDPATQLALVLSLTIPSCSKSNPAALDSVGHTGTSQQAQRTIGTTYHAACKNSRCCAQAPANRSACWPCCMSCATSLPLCLPPPWTSHTSEFVCTFLCKQIVVSSVVNCQPGFENGSRLQDLVARDCEINACHLPLLGTKLGL